MLGDNQISDISPLAGLTSLKRLQLEDNEISDIAPLVANSGLGTRARVHLSGNPLDLSAGSEASQDLQTLRDRGVAADADTQ